MIDLGAVSTAPGSPPISEAMERERLFPALKEILDNLDITVSVDTQRARIAEDALSCGAACINDVSGLTTPEMASSVARIRRLFDHHGLCAKTLAICSDMNQIIPIWGKG